MNCRRAALFLAAAVAVGCAALCALYLLSDPADAIGQDKSCTTAAAGPFLIEDCGLSQAAPLRVYSRFPVRLLGTCGYWTDPDRLLCSTVFWLRNI